MPDLSRHVRVGWALADQSVVSLANFLTVYLFARHLAPAAFGAFIFGYTGLVLLNNLQNALLVQPHNVLGAPLPGPRYRRFTGALVLAQLALCACASAALAAAGWLAARLGAPAPGAELQALAAAAPFWMGQEFVRRVLYTRRRTLAAALNDATTYGLQLAGAVALAFAPSGRASAGAALLVLGGSSLAGVLIGAWQLRPQVRFGGPQAFARVLRTWREAWHFGKWLLGQNVVGWFGAQGHVWIVGLLLGVEQVGLYRAATHLVNVMNPLLQTSYSYLPARGSVAFQRGGAEGLSRWVARTRRLLAFAPLPFCIVLVGFPGQVLQLAYGDRYTGTIMPLVLALAAVAVCITFAKYPFDLGLLALRSTRSIFYVHLIPVGLLLTSGVALVHIFGVLGVPLSAMAINSTLLLATWRAYRRQLARARIAGLAGGLASA